MKNVISDKVLGLQPSGIRKFFDIVSEMDDVISLGVGEPDFDTPWHIRDEGIYSLERGRTFYTSNAGLKELREEICRYLSRRCKVDYTIDETLITVGGSEAIDLAMRVLLNPGDEVLIPQPSFVSYLPCAVLADGVPVVINLKAENEFRLTAQELEDAITDKTKLLVLPFPNNPTGAVYTEPKCISLNIPSYSDISKSGLARSMFKTCPQSSSRLMDSTTFLISLFVFIKIFSLLTLKALKIFTTA